MNSSNEEEFFDCIEPDSIETAAKNPRKFKIVLVGDGGTGKTSYVGRLNDGAFKKEYIATIGIEKHTVSVATNFGEYLVEICDTAGQEKIGPLRDGYYVGVHSAILFFDVTSRITYKNIVGWHRDITRICTDIPMVLCANKIDIKERKVKLKSIDHHKKLGMGFYEISVETRKNLKEPIQYLLRQLTKQSDLEIIDSLGTDAFQFNKINIG